ncbi:MAG: hypothetical protein AAF585_10840 [Verrucomicrobiota bacterium]
MRKNPPLLILILVTMLVSGVLYADPTDRSWTGKNGNELKARLVGINRDTVDIRLSSTGRVVQTKIELLSDKDRKYVAEWRALGFGTKVERWPNELRPMMNFSAKTLGKTADDIYVYTTPNYEFRCDVELQQSLIKEYSLAFEGTYYAIANLPLGLNPTPPETRFVVRLFKERSAYLEAGGPQGSAGVYLLKSREILVPMESLGVQEVGRRVAIDRRKYDSGTLIHEITHQVMYEWLEALPVWFVEGIAEYMSAVPFDDARFDFRKIHEGIKDHLETEYRTGKTNKGIYMVDVAHPEQLMSMTHQQWSNAVSSAGSNASINYCSAMMLIYYYIHLDGAGDGSSMVAYMHQAREKQTELKSYINNYNAAVDSYNQALREYNQNVETYNAALTAFRSKLEAYNRSVRRFNSELASGKQESEIKPINPDPGSPPKPPVEPKLPKILADNPNGGGMVDLMKGETEARRALLRKRSADELWHDMEKAFAKHDIQIRQVSAVGASAGFRATPIRQN